MVNGLLAWVCSQLEKTSEVRIWTDVRRRWLINYINLVILIVGVFWFVIRLACLFTGSTLSGKDASRSHRDVVLASRRTQDWRPTNRVSSQKSAPAVGFDYCHQAQHMTLTFIVSWFLIPTSLPIAVHQHLLTCTPEDQGEGLATGKTCCDTRRC